MASQVNTGFDSEHALREACGELERRLRAGESVTAEQLLAARSDLSGSDDWAIELIYTEYVTREELGTRPEPEEVYRRFPQWRARLERLLEVHSALALPDALSVAVGGDTPLTEHPTVVPEPGPSLLERYLPWIIARYELLEPLGRGGMGVVYKARQRGLDRIVALKLTRNGSLATDEERVRFRQEAEAAAGLQHPHIVQIFDVGEQDGSPFLSMEFLDAGNLEQWLGEATLPADDAARLVATLAEAVQYAHERGIIHRDLKTANILLSWKRKLPPGNVPPMTPGVAGPTANWQLDEVIPKISDFGLAKRIEGASDVTGTGQILGTPSYMAPEQTTGRTLDVGPAADIYALGAILYRLLTGRPPFQGETIFEVLEQLRSQQPVPPRRLRPKLPRDLETICLRCLEKDPRKRYPTADALANDLRRFLARESIEARPLPFWGRAWNWARRRPAVAALIMTIAAVILLGFPAITTLWLRAQAAWKNTEEARLGEEAGRERAERLLYRHSVALAHHEYLSNSLDRAHQLLDGCRTDLRHWEWHYLKQLCQQEQFRLAGHTLPVSGIAFSPDGTRLASCSSKWGSDEAGEVIVWDAIDGTALLTLRGHPSSITSVAFSPDGRRLASAGVVWFDKTISGVKLWDLDSGSELFSITGHGNIYSVAFRPDGKLLALGTVGGLVKLCDSLSGTEVATLAGHAAGVYCLAFSPDGTRLASASHDHTTRLWDLSTAAEVAVLHSAADVRSIAYSPDGRKLAAAAYHGIVSIWDVGEEPVSLVPVCRWDSGGRSPRIAFSPDGRHLAVASLETPIALVDPANGKRSHTIQSHGLAGTKVLAFAPDGRRLATAGGDRLVKLWDLSGPVMPRQWALKELAIASHLSSMAISPDGSLLALASTVNRSSPGRGGSETTLILCEMAEKKTREFKEHAGWLTSVAFSPDGRRIVTGSEDHTAKLWEAATGKVLFTLEGHTATVTDVAFSPQGDRIVSAGSDHTIRVWDPTTGQQLRALEAHQGAVSQLAYCPDSRYLASAGADGLVKIWDVSTWRPQVSLEINSRDVCDLAFSPDGNLLACCGDDLLIHIWELRRLLDPQQAPRPLYTLRGHTDRVVSLAFSENSKRLASVSTDQTLKLWMLDTGQEVFTLRSFLRDSCRVLFAPGDDRILLTSGAYLLQWDAHWEPGESARARHPVAWHRAQAAEAEQERQWFASAFHLDQLIDRQPERWQLYIRRGRAHAALARWPDAAADYARGLELRGDDLELLFEQAAVALLAQQPEIYQPLCQQLLTQHGATSEHRTAYLVARICALSGDHGANYRQWLRLAERAASAHPECAWYMHARALAQYRCGLLEEAIRSAEKSMQYSRWEPQVVNWLTLALASHRLGRTEEARQWYDKSEQWLNSIRHEASQELVATFWNPHDWLACELLRQEAAALLAPPRKGTTHQH
jgi:eukaryotic-like serine/threonine-protein kinase